MSRIFEALQHAEKERLRRRKAVEEQKNLPRGNVDRTLTVDMADPHHCVEFAVRVGREGPVDFLYRVGWDVSLAMQPLSSVLSSLSAITIHSKPGSATKHLCSRERRRTCSRKLCHSSLTSKLQNWPRS